MRTTIELKPEYREKLNALAVARGEKDFSGIINQAVADYLRQHDTKSRKSRLALMKQVRGMLSDKEAANAKLLAKESRESW